MTNLEAGGAPQKRMRRGGTSRRAWGGAVVALLCASVVGYGLPASGATSWTIAASPDPTGSTGSYLNGVSCTSATNCFAVGYFTTASSPGRAFVERWNGTKWSIVTSNVPSGSTGSYLNGVSCTSTTNCFAVGYFTTASNPGRTLIERWNGTRWLVLAGANATGSLGSYLSGVSCTSTTSCAAVGYSYDSKATKTLAARWSGTKWSVVASPNPAGDESNLLGVSCAGTGCIAAGYYTSAQGSGRTLVERWNGTKWSIASSPNPAGSDSYLNGVSCASATSCVAVGEYYGTTGPGRTLVERWTGAGWSIVSSPNPAGSDTYLAGVRCTSATNCVAVGSYPAPPDQTLVERWNGAGWSIVASPNPAGSTGSHLNAVSCAGAFCVAVGDYVSGAHKTLVERG
jgi:hypothetical protein